MSGPPLSLHAELLLRIAMATALGAIIGLERESHRRPAGLRTHMLVALASATFMAVSTHFVYFQNARLMEETLRRRPGARRALDTHGARPAAEVIATELERRGLLSA